MKPDLHILVVDDTPTMRLIVSTMLEELGYASVEQAEDAEVAWTMIQAPHVQKKGRPFDLVLADWNMPGMTGVELLRATRAYEPCRKLPFIMMTSENDSPHIAEALQSGVSSYLVKPFGPVELQERIDEAFKPSR